MFQIFKNFVSSFNLDPMLESAILSGANILYEDICGSGEAIGLNSYDGTHFRNLSEEPKEHPNRHWHITQHEDGEDACDVNDPNKGKNGKSGRSGDKVKASSGSGNKTPGKGGRGQGRPGGIYHSMGKGKGSSGKLNSAKNNFGKFVTKLGVGEKEKSPLIRGFEEFMSNALKKKS